tara:strand:+ start:717 stop:1352 length:636 start_codon:yes stop_codon:yes gene_type:complete
MTQGLLGRCEWVTPPNLGWLQYSLVDKEIDYLWNCINNKKEYYSDKLAGNITGSYTLVDKNDWFFNQTLHPLIKVYAHEFANLGENTPMLNLHPYTLGKWWVNYQKQHDFNPTHDHTGVYSFVIWLKIPYEYEEQNKDNTTNNPVRSTFQFHYQNILGEPRNFTYQLGKNYEGQLLFFPSQLFHEVYPFYDCDEDRISISGNIWIDETREL